MAKGTAGFKGHLSIKTLTSGTFDFATAERATAASGWNELKFTNATITDTRETDDVTESGEMARNFDVVLRTWSFSVDFIRKTSTQVPSYTAQQALFDAFDDMDPLVAIRLVDAPSGANRALAAGDSAKLGQVQITGITETNDVGTDVRVSVTMQGTGPLYRADLT